MYSFFPARAWTHLRLSATQSSRTAIIGRPLPGRLARQCLRNETTQSEASAAAKTVSRLDRFIARTPTKFLRSRLQVLRKAPLTHVVAFLLLHEITAVVPLFSLAAAFHYFQWLPAYFAEGEWVLQGVTMFGNWFRRRGWITASDADSAKTAAEEGRATEAEKKTMQERLSTSSNKDGTESRQETFPKWWETGAGGTRVVIEFATAYAVVKVLMPLRIVLSIWWAPWFARTTVVPVQNVFKRMIGWNKRAKTPVNKSSGGTIK